MIPREFSIAVTLVLTAVLAGCGGGPDSESDGGSADSGRPEVWAVNYPLQYFARRIAGNLADVRMPASRGADPAFWKPEAETVAAMQNADLILLNGAGYAHWLDQVTLPPSILVDTSRAFAAQYLQAPDTGKHSHGTDGEHSHGGTAFTTWLDFQQATRQAEAVAHALADLFPAERTVLAANLEDLQGDLASLHEEMLGLGEILSNQPLIASHPVYHYWARRYGLEVHSVLWEPDEAPDEGELAALEALLAAHSAKRMIWEAVPTPEVLARLEGFGLRHAVLDPCAGIPDSGDWLAVMKENIANLKAMVSP